MTTDLAFHYPPDVFDAVVDAVPLLTRGKHDVVMFFRGCGVDRAFLAASTGASTRSPNSARRLGCVVVVRSASAPGLPTRRRTAHPM